MNSLNLINVFPCVVSGQKFFAKKNYSTNIEAARQKLFKYLPNNKSRKFLKINLIDNLPKEEFDFFRIKYSCNNVAKSRRTYSPSFSNYVYNYLKKNKLSVLKEFNNRNNLYSQFISKLVSKIFKQYTLEKEIKLINKNYIINNKFYIPYTARGLLANLTDCSEEIRILDNLDVEYHPSIYRPTTVRRETPLAPFVCENRIPEVIQQRDRKLLDRLRSIILLFRENASKGANYIYNLLKGPINEGMIDEVEMKELEPPEVAEAQMMNEVEGAHGSGDCVVKEESNVAVVEEVKPSIAKPVIIPNDIWENMCSSQQYSSQTDLMSRWKLFKIFEWSAGSQQDAPIKDFNPNAKKQLLPIQVSLPFDFISLNSESPNCILFKQFAYFRGDMEIQIKVNATQFYMGQLQASFYYASDFDARYKDRSNISTSSQMSHALIDASSNNPAILQIPYRYYKPLMGTCIRKDDDDNIRMGHLRIMILNQLRAPEGANTTVNVAVYLRFVNPRFHGMKPRSLGKLKVESSENQMMRNIIKGTIDGGVESLLNQVFPDNNRDNPPSVLPPRPMVPWTAHSWAVGDKCSEPINPLRMQATGQTPFPPGTLPSEPEMDLNYVIQKFGYVNTFSWDVSLQSGSKIFSVPFSPILRKKDYKNYNISNFEKRECWSLTPIGFISQMFAYWRGSIEFRLDVVATAFHRGTLILAFIPRIEEQASVTLDTLTDCDHMIVNLSDCRQFSFICKYVADKPWWPRKKYILDGDASYAPGYLYCCVVNSLRALNAVSSTVELNLYMRAHTDFEVQILSNSSYGLSFNTNVVDDDSTLVSYANNYGPPNDEIYCSDWSGVFAGKYVFRYGTGSGKITPFNPTVIEQYFVVWKLYDQVTGTIWLYDVNKQHYAADWLLLVPSPVMDLTQSGAWTTAHGIPIKADRDILKTLKSKIGAIYKDVWNSNPALTKITLEKGASAEICSKLHTAYLEVASYYGGTATDAFSPQHKIYWESHEGLFAYQLSEDFILVEQQSDERDCMIGDEVSLHPNIVSTWSGLMTFGEQITSLKQIIRRYSPYSMSTHKWEENDGFNVARVDTIIPLLPQGLALEPSSGNFYANYVRDGIISQVLSGYRFYRGGLRLRIILSAKVNLQIWVQHIPDAIMTDQRVIDLPFVSGQVPQGARFILNSGYALFVQDTSINPVLEIEIPYYACTQLSLLQRPKMTMKQDGVIYTLGNLNIGYNRAVQTDTKVSKTIITLTMYACADDFSATVFQGFPLVFDIEEVKKKKTDLKFETAQAQGLGNYFMDKIDNIAEKRAKKKLGVVVEDVLASTSLDKVDSPDGIIHYLMELLPADKAIGLWRVMREFVHMYLGGSVKSIAFSIINIFTEIGMISYKVLRTAADLLYKLLDKFKVFCSKSETPKKAEEGATAVAQGLFDSEEDASQCEAAFVSTLVSGIFATLGIVGKPLPNSIPSFAKFIYNGTTTYTKNANGLFTFFKNNLKMLKAMWCWVVSLVMPEHTLAVELQNSTDEVIDFARKVTYCLDARNDSVIRNDPASTYQVYECANIAQILLCKFVASDLDARRFVLLREHCNKIVALRDKLSRELLSPPVRFEPFVLCISGESNIGKSYVCQKIVSEMLTSINYKSFNQLIYTRTPGNAYWNSLNNQPAVVYDDWMAIGDNVFGAQQCSELFCLKSCAVFNPPLAAIEDKNIKYNPLTVVMLTNKPFLVPNCIATPEAILRRRDLLVEMSFTNEYKGKKISQIPSTVKAKMEHLKFTLYSDPTKEGSKESVSMTYAEFNSYLCTQFRDYYTNELINYNERMKIQRKFHPDVNLNLDMNLDKVTAGLVEYEKKLVGTEYVDLLKARESLRNFARMKDFTKIYNKRVERLMNTPAVSVSKSTGQVTSSTIQLPFECGLSQGPDSEDEDVCEEVKLVDVPSFKEKAVQKLKALKGKPTIRKSFNAAQFLRGKNEDTIINLNCDGYLFGECRCADFLALMDSFTLLDDSVREELKHIKREHDKICKIDPTYVENVTESWIHTEPIMLYDCTTGVKMLFVPCSSERCVMRFDPTNCSTVKKTSLKSLLTKVHEIYGNLANFKNYPQWYQKIYEYLYADQTASIAAADKIINEVAGTEAKAWYEKLWEKIPSFWTVVKFLGSAALFMSLLKIAVAATLGITNSLGLTNIPTNIIATSTAVGSAACGSNALVSASLVGTMETHNELAKAKMNTLGQMPSSGSSASVAKAGIGRVTVRNFVQSQSMASDQKNVLIKKIVRNTFWIQYKNLDTGKTLEVRCLGITTRFAIFLDHYILEIYRRMKVDENYEIKFISVDFVTEFDLAKAETFTLENSAIVVVKMPKIIPHFRNLVPLFSEVAMTGNVTSKGNLIETVIPTKVGEPSMVHIHNFLFGVQNKSLLVTNDDSSITTVSRTYVYPKSGRGLCGSLLLGDVNSDRPILGIHIAGKPDCDVGFAEMLIYEEFLSLMTDTAQSEAKFDSVEPGMITLPYGVIFEGNVDRNLAQRISPHSRLAHTICAGKITPITYDKPVLSSNDERIANNPFSPLREGIVYHGLSVRHFDDELVKLCGSKLSERYNALLRPQRTKIGKLTVEESIIGIYNIPEYDGLDMKSSEGYPWNLERPGNCSDKSWLFEREIEPNGRIKLLSINSKLAETLRVNEKCRRMGIPIDTIFADLLKDAKLPKEKVLIPGKTRIFSASPIDYTIASRQCFLDFSVALKCARFKNFVGIGIDVQSIEATILANYLLEVGDNIIVGDYKKFGDSLMSNCVLEVFEIIIRWYKCHCQLDEKDLNEMRALCEEVMFSKHIALNTVYSMLNGMPSGNPLTVDINSIVNIIYIMVMYLQITKKNLPSHYGCDKFFENVRLVTYGDDLIMSVHDEIKDVFNFVTIRDEFKNYGIEFTSASKTESEKKWHSILDTEVTFLKCNFILHPTRPGNFLMALDKRSIEETCNWYWTTSKDEYGSSIEACCAMVRNAYGHGPEYYNNLRLKVLCYWASKGNHLIIPDWDELDYRNFNKN